MVVGGCVSAGQEQINAYAERCKADPSIHTSRPWLEQRSEAIASGNPRCWAAVQEMTDNMNYDAAAGSVPAVTVLPMNGIIVH